MKSITAVLLLAIVLSACSPAAAPTATFPPPTATVPPPTATVPPPTATAVPPTSPPLQTPAADLQALGADIDAMFQKSTKAGAFSGAVLVAKNGQVILSQGYGFADRAKNIPNTPQTKFRIGGFTHGFAANAIMILQEQGKLTVQDKLCKYLADCPEAWKPITLHHLLTRSSGTQYTWGPHTAVDKMIADAKAQPLAFQPGERYDAGNLDYALLGKVIEAASGQTFEAFLQKTIFEPLQMSSTGYDHRQADLALGYASTGNSTVDLSDPEALFSMGALYSSAEDLYRWDQALYTEKLMPQKALAAMFTAAAVPMPSDWPSGWAPAYSWVIGPGKPLCLEQDNGLPGYKSVIYRYPEDKSVIIILTNQESVNPWTDAADLVAKKLFGLGCGEIASPKPTATVAPPQAPAADIKALNAEADALFQDMVKAGTFSGSALIAQNGQIILSQGYGFADRAKKTPNTPQTKFRLGSLTKQFTAMAIMILQEQGKLNVQDKVCAYLTDCPESWKPITLHQLLTHSSGIHDTSDPNTTLEKMFAYAKLIPLDFQPGTSWNYCNIGFGLLGKVIEAASGQTYEAFLQKNIFEPLQMSNSGYDHGQPDLALGYADKGDSAVTPWDGQALFSFGALYSTAEDLYRWDQALYTEKLVSQKSLDAIFTAQVHLPAYPDWGYGYGWFIGPPALHFINHQGVVPGFGSIIYRYPDDKTTIIMLTNQQAVDEQAVNDLIGRADLVAKKLFGK